MTVHHTVPDSSAADPVRPPVERRTETPRAAGFAGLAFAVLFVGSVALLRGGPVDRQHGGGDPELLPSYGQRQRGARRCVSRAVLRDRVPVVHRGRNLIGDREDRFFATVFLRSGLLFVAMLFIAAGVAGSLPAAVKFKDAPVPAAETVVTVRRSGSVSSSSTPCGWPRCS